MAQLDFSFGTTVPPKGISLAILCEYSKVYPKSKGGFRDFFEIRDESWSRICNHLESGVFCVNIYIYTLFLYIFVD